MEANELIGYIGASTQEVFATMLGMEVQPGEAYSETTPSSPGEGVIALIGLAGEWIGTGGICCSAAFACKIASQMLMAEATAVDGDVLDAVAEVANMVIGNVKTAVENRLGPMGMSIPTIIFGKNFTARSVGNEAWRTVPFFFEGERLEVKMCLAPNRGTHTGHRPGFTTAYSMEPCAGERATS